ncbi:MAG: response regulator [Verrucomicrobiaceae bacterium]|nr:response regulator [Verrucomicrobiaceae bacterium]
MRILVVEDDKALGAAITKSLQQAGFAVDWVETARTALQFLTLENFDLLLLDLGLPDSDGYTVVRKLRESGKSLPILILTARDALDDRVRGLDQGADDYVVKPIAMPELHARVRALLRRRMTGGNPSITLKKLVLDTVGRRAYVESRSIDLTAREWSVLEYLVGNSGRIVSKDQLIQAIASWDRELSQNAIEAYVHRIRGKIEGSEVVIKTVRGLGYLLEEPTNAP